MLSENMEYTSREVYEYISKQANDPIVEWKKCRASWKEFPIYQSDLEFYDRVSPTFDVSEDYVREFLEKNNDIKDNFEYKDGKLKAKIPAPTLCPEERERRRFAFRNETSLYINTCKHSCKSIISIFSPDKPNKVYDQDYWWTFARDVVNPLNDSPSFKDNYPYLLSNIPVPSRSILNNENCDYLNEVRDSKDSYMCFNCIGNDKCLYTYLWYSNDVSCVDCDAIDRCSFCYDSVQLTSCTQVFHSKKCINCSFSSYLYNCIGCNNCFNCVNLNNKSYCINNKQYTKEEYEKELKEAKKEDLTFSNICWNQTESDMSFGNELMWCKNCRFVSWLTNCENVRYTRDMQNMSDSYDSKWINSSLTIETYFTWGCHHCWFLQESRSNTDVRYSLYCHNSDHLLGCVGLQNKSYCIFNKQYTKEEYNSLAPVVISGMIRDNIRWEYFNPQLSFFGYNETIAMESYPLTKKEALERWYKWSDYESPAPVVEKFVPWEKLPKQWCKIIQEKKPDILKKILDYAIVRDVSKKPFRVTKQEIDFYLKFDLPLPTKHPNIRHQERFSKKDPTMMHLIHCDSCGEEMLSVHLSWEWNRVLCEKCFYKENQ